MICGTRAVDCSCDASGLVVTSACQVFHNCSAIFVAVEVLLSMYHFGFVTPLDVDDSTLNWGHS